MTGSEISGILSKALKAICETFGFDRAFVMLVDENLQTLRTAQVRSKSESDLGSNRDLIANFSVNVAMKRNEGFLLSSVFHTQVPVLIENAEAHLFQLNAESRNLILRLKSKSFIMVPIPGKSTAWGVIVADRIGSEKRVDKYDLVLLQNIGQHLGLALSKQADLNREINLRRGFEKYVPREIVEGALKNQAPSLGGQERKIICLFLDIRGFTAFSARLQPQVTIEILNRVFSMAHGVITNCNGLIDKFLGDGVLAVWGALGSDDPTAETAIRCALEILEKLGHLNEEFIQQGLPNIAVGMGIDKGTAICGNVGSESRLEFTSIGQPVNLASRLEGLCKLKTARIIVSERVAAEASLTAKDGWSFEDNVQVRGIHHPVRIGIFH
jgi:class 3 adenylate cyclase